MTSPIVPPPGMPPTRTAPAWLEWSVAILSTALVVGVYLDGWAHIRELPENFFSPWHGVIYGSFGLLALVLAWAAVSGRSRKGGWRHALAPGYGLSFVGAGLFMVAGAADFLKLAPKTLAHMRGRGDGPKYVRANARVVRYRLADLEAWLEARVVSSTSEPIAA